MSNFVFVIDAQKRPLAPIHPGFARRLLKQKQAALYRKFPFTLILKESRPDLIRPDLKDQDRSWFSDNWFCHIERCTSHLGSRINS
jgi:hypothetical protein